MIPKFIHYCWFGEKPKSESALKCIESWKKHAPDFEIIEWNENNTKRYQNKFYKDSYRKGNYAFVSDTIRVSVLYDLGGIYMDLDMMLLKPLNNLVQYDFFSGYEVNDRVAYGLFGGLPRHRYFEKMRNFYESTCFNQFSLPVITHTFSAVIHRSTLLDNERIFDSEYFYALSYKDRQKDYESFIKPNSLAIHLWDHSWLQKKQKDSICNYIKNIQIVAVDYFFYNYPNSYFRRYIRGFSRKIAQKLLSRK